MESCSQVSCRERRTGAMSIITIYECSKCKVRSPEGGPRMPKDWTHAIVDYHISAVAGALKAGYHWCPKCSKELGVYVEE